MKRLIGWVLMAVPFVAVIVACVLAIGWIGLLIVLGSVIAIFLFFSIGAFLISR